MPRVKTIESRTEEFTKMVMAQAAPVYSPILEEFISYWTEPDKAGKKIRYDGEKYFKVNSRLATWQRRKKFNPQEVTEAVKRPTGKLEQMSIDDLKNAYNHRDENGKVKIDYFDVFNFLVKKRIITSMSKAGPKTKEYYRQKEMQAGAFIIARLVDKKKKLDAGQKMDVDRRIERVKNYQDHEIKPLAQCLVLDDLFKKYTLEELLNKIQ